MKFTVTLNFDNGEEVNDIEIEAPDANYALDKAIANYSNEEIDTVSSFVIVGVRD